MGWRPLVGYDPNNPGGAPAAPAVAAEEAAPLPELAPRSLTGQIWDTVKPIGRTAASTLLGTGRTEFPEAEEFLPQYVRESSRDAAGNLQPTAADDVLKSAVTPNEAAQFDILSKAIPGLERQADAHGNLMLKAPGMRSFAYLNKPGASARDLDEFGTQTLATLPFMGPAGRAVTTTGRIVKGALGLGGGSVAQDLIAGEMGSEQGVDPERALLSAGLGGGVPAAAALARGTAGFVTGKVQQARDLAQNVANPKAAAQREVQRAFQEDFDSGTLLDPRRVAQKSDKVLAAGLNQDLRVMDFGGEAVQREGRKAANFSPSAKSEIMRVLDSRFEGQTERATDLIETRFGLSRSADQVRSDLMNQARTLRAPLYNQAFSQGAGGIDTPVIDRLMTSGTFQRAMGRAEHTLADQNAMPGWRPWQARASANGGPYTLAYWDQVKRNLDDYAGQAIRTGKKNQAAIISQMAQTLRGELDKAVPVYRQARGLAQDFFNADNALEAGENFAKGSFNFQAAEQMITRMNTAEKSLFAEGFADHLVRRLRDVRDRSNLLNRFMQSPNEQRRIQLALGQQRFDQIEAMMRLEGVMDRMRTAMGNSTTAQQAADMLKGYGVDVTSMLQSIRSPTAMIIGLITAGGRAAQLRVNENVAREIGELLTSKDPEVFLQGLQQLSKTPIIDAIRAIDDLVGTLQPIAIQQGVNAQAGTPVRP